MRASFTCEIYRNFYWDLMQNISGLAMCTRCLLPVVDDDDSALQHPDRQTDTDRDTAPKAAAAAAAAKGNKWLHKFIVQRSSIFRYFCNNQSRPSALLRLLHLPLLLTSLSPFLSCPIEHRWTRFNYSAFDPRLAAIFFCLFLFQGSTDQGPADRHR